MNYMTVEPRVMPRGLSDAVIGFGVGFGMVYLFFLLSAGLAHVVRILTHNSLAGALGFVAMWALAFLLSFAFSVQRLRCDEQGLEFVRPLAAFGRRTKIPWAMVESVEEVSRKEVMLRGWLTPFLVTASWTSLGYFRIRWQGGTAYFPPRDIARFLYAIQIGRDYAARQRAGATPFPPPHSTQAEAELPN